MGGSQKGGSAARRYDPALSERRKRLEGAPLASFRRRALAFVLDLLIAGALFLPLAIGALQLLYRVVPDEGSLIWKAIEHVSEVTVKNGERNLNLRLGFFSNAVSVVWWVLYFGFSHYWGQGRTLGKRLAGIRVVSLDHERIGFWHSMERALAYGASALEAGFGFFQYFLDRNRRTVHDRIAETIVVREERKKKPAKTEAKPSSPPLSGEG
jgi:uncharacterized RDD family membrane protein YckC